MRYILCLCLFFSQYAYAQIAPERGSGTIAKYVVKAKQQMVVTAHPLATQAAQFALKKGGNAIDAAIAAQMVLNVVEPQSSGIGGGGFLLYYHKKSGELYSYDGREIAPKNVTPSLFMKKDGSKKPFMDAVRSGDSVGVPGLLRMLEMAHQNHGVLPWSDGFSAAIAVAEQGFLPSPRLRALLASSGTVKQSSSAQLAFAGKDGVVAQGETLANPDLAEVFKEIAQEGSASFYKGKIAADIVKAVEPAPLSLEDMAAYQAKSRTPVCLPYRIYHICSMPTPSSGGITILQILGILEQFELGKMEPFSVQPTHLIAEATRLSFADRNRFIADSDFVDVPVQALLAPEYLKKRAALIDPKKAATEIAPGLTDLPSHNPSDAEKESTTHISIVDQEGNAVSMTTSIEHAFGSGIAVNGFLLNNQLTDFDFIPFDQAGNPVANRIEPHKRPRSSMAPTLVFDQEGELFLTIGTPGGARIIPYMVQALIHILDWNQNIQTAIDAPHIVKIGETLELEEDGHDETLKQALEALGHKVELREHTSGLHVIKLEKDQLLGAADKRREGVAEGR